jgi:hypothetical protein
MEITVRLMRNGKEHYSYLSVENKKLTPMEITRGIGEALTKRFQDFELLGISITMEEI